MAEPTALGILLLVFFLEMKHFVCDGPLQTSKMVVGKAIYGNVFGLIHAGLHGVASLIVLDLFGMSWWPALPIALAEGAIHYHIDFFKENLVRWAGWTVRDRLFWWTLAGDQSLHHFTYIAMAAAVVLLAR
ncbi:MAG: DUF3307 domain-containing protein [Rhizobiales bacterium]|nr:DUF3307 domain-containing protein [Hyphomicrobiales bacterium]MBI3674649.1 DUF3307 domain-containing protein [Hyphomicrobiales bacterium]